MSTYSSPSIWSASSSCTRGRSSSGVSERASHSCERVPLLERLDLARPRARPPRAASATRPRCRSGRASGRAASRPPRRPRSRRACPRRRRGRCATRAISATAAAMSSKWCGAIRVTTRSKAPSANGRSSARQITSGCIPGAGSALTTWSPASRSRRATWPPPVATSSAVREPSAQLDDQVEILALALLGGVPVGLGARRPVAHRRSAAVSCSVEPTPLRQLHGLAGPVEHRRLDVEVRRRRVGEDLAPLLGVRAVEPHDDRLLDRHPLERGEDAARDLVAARDAAEDVEEDRLHLRVLQ